MAATRVQRTLYKALLRRAKLFDDQPHLKFLINTVHSELPLDLQSVVGGFLGGEHRRFYLPSPVARQSMQDVVHNAFHFPDGGVTVDTAFTSLRYLNSLVAIATKHGMLPGACVPATAASSATTCSIAGSSSSSGDGGGGGSGSGASPQQQQQPEGSGGGVSNVTGAPTAAGACSIGSSRDSQSVGSATAAAAAATTPPPLSAAAAATPRPTSTTAAAATVAGGGSERPLVQQLALPSRGAVLLAHPLLEGVFTRTAVLLCHHNFGGAWGVIINKPTPYTLAAFFKQGAGRRRRSSGWSSSSPSFQRSIPEMMRLLRYQAAEEQGDEDDDEDDDGLDPSAHISFVVTSEDDGGDGFQRSGVSVVVHEMSHDDFMRTAHELGQARPGSRDWDISHDFSDEEDDVSEDDSDSDEYDVIDMDADAGEDGQGHAQEQHDAVLLAERSCGVASVGVGVGGRPAQGSDGDDASAPLPSPPEARGGAEVDAPSEGGGSSIGHSSGSSSSSVSDQQQLASGGSDGSSSSSRDGAVSEAGSAEHGAQPELEQQQGQQQSVVGHVSGFLSGFLHQQQKGPAGTAEAAQPSSGCDSVGGSGGGDGNNPFGTAGQPEGHQSEEEEDSSSSGGSSGGSQLTSAILQGLQGLPHSSALRQRRRPAAGPAGAAARGSAADGRLPYAERRRRFRGLLRRVGTPPPVEEAQQGLGSVVEEHAHEAQALEDVLKGLSSNMIWRGGPVEGLMVLHRMQGLGGEAVLGPAPSRGLPGVYSGALLVDVRDWMQDGRLSQQDLRFFVGDSHWGQQQLERELRQGMWVVADADPSALALFQDSDEDLQRAGNLWEDLLEGLGPEYAAMRRVPPGVVRDLKQLQL